MTSNEARVRETIARLDYDFRQFTVSHFIAHLEALRRRDIVLVGYPFDRGCIDSHPVALPEEAPTSQPATPIT